MSSSRRELGYGLAIAIGFPLALVSVLAWSGELVGFPTGQNWLPPAFAGPGFVLAGIGLHGLSQRLDITSADSKSSTIGPWLGVALGLAGIAGMYGPTENDYFAGFTVPAAFVSLTWGLATMGRIALHKRSFGTLSFIPLAVAASGGVWFLSLFPPVFGGYQEVAQAFTLLVHVTLWFALGALVGTDAPGSSHSVGPAERRQIH